MKKKTQKEEIDDNPQKDSLYVYLKNRGVPIETLSLIKEFYETKWVTNPTNRYPNQEDNDVGKLPFGKHKGKVYSDPTIPQTYLKWVLSQEKLLLNYPLFGNFLKKNFVELPSNKPPLERTKGLKVSKLCSFNAHTLNKEHADSVNASSDDENETD